MYFCCLEALQNAGIHAGGDASVTVRLRDEGGVLRFEVRGDGVGFERVRTQDNAGLTSMRDRVGGEFENTSARGLGRTVSGSIPLGA